MKIYRSGGQNNNGKTSTANFLQGMLGSIPPLDDIFKSAGMELPSYLKGQIDESDTEKIKDPVDDSQNEENVEDES